MKDAYVAAILSNSLDIVVCKNGFCLAGGGGLERPPALLLVCFHQIKDCPQRDSPQLFY
jgi:hypothetical protein